MRPAFRPADLAIRWGVSTGHLHNMIRKGELRAFRIGTLYRISADEVDRIEGCVSNSIEENGPSSEPQTARSGGARFGPVIAPPPNGASRTTGSRHRGRQ